MIKAIVGANWGDEGKGKITDVFASEADVVVRFQGGNNAGHTIINDYGKFSLHMIPSGVFYDHTVNIIGNGVALNVKALLSELEQLEKQNVPTPQLYVSDKAQVVMSYHKLFDEAEEARLKDKQFGSTKSGISPFYADKFAKVGFQVSELFDENWLREKIDRILPQKNVILKHLYNREPLNSEDIFNECIEYRDLIKPYVIATEDYLLEAYNQGKTILLEGQLGALRDPDFGIYPYSTSSSTLAYYGTIGAGLPKPIDEVIAVTKAYSSAVGEGPFVAELFGDQAHELRKRGGDAGEYGATTGRPRRVGFFDVVATRYGSMVQGATGIALTNIDVLSYLETIPVVIGYKENDIVHQQFVSQNRQMNCEPELTTYPGWLVDITDVKSYDDLPENAKNYIDALEQHIGVPIIYVSNGPKRSQLMKRIPKI